MLASATFEDEGETKRPTVQVGDPFTEKVLIECCLEIFAADLVVGIQDLGARRAVLRDHRARRGRHRRHGRRPRPRAAARPDARARRDPDERVAGTHDGGRHARAPRRVPGRLREVGRRRHRHRHGHRHRPAADALARRAASSTCRRGTAAHEGPVYERPIERPARPGRAASSTTAATCRVRATATSCARPLLRLVASPNLADKSWVTDQYDRYVLGNTVLAQPEDAGMIRLDESTHRGVALSTDGNGRYTPARPVRRRAARARRGLPQRRGHRRAPARRHQLPQLRLARGPGRHVAVRRGGARPRRRVPRSSASRSPAATSASTTRPATTAILPTPVVGVLGVIDDVTRRTAAGLPRRRRVDLPARRDARRVRRLGVGARRARLPRRPAAGGRPRPRARAGRRADRRGRATGCSTPRTTCPRAASRRRWSRHACAATSARASTCRTAPTRSSRCSASRPAARSSRSRALRRPDSARCAPSADCRVRASAWSTCSTPSSRCRTSSRCSLADLRSAWSRPLPALFA